MISPEEAPAYPEGNNEHRDANVSADDHGRAPGRRPPPKYAVPMADFLNFVANGLHITREAAQVQIDFTREAFPVEWEIIDQPHTEKFYGETLQMYNALAHRRFIPNAVQGSNEYAWNSALTMTYLRLGQKLKCIRPTTGQ